MFCRKLSAYAVVMCAWAVSQQASAIEIDICKFSMKTPAVFFSNGVGNTPHQARISLKEASLQLKTGAALVAPEGSVATTELLADSTSFVSLYHANNGAVQDISETLLQKARAEARSEDVTWDHIIALAKGLPAPTIAISQMLSAIASFNADEIRRKALTQVAEESRHDLDTITAYLKSKPGARALVIGHSQGTLYANALYESAIALQAAGWWNLPMTVEESVRVVNVGVAADRVAGQMNPADPPQYVTSSNDLVILGLRGLSAAIDLSPPLPTNNGAHFVTSAPGAGLLGFNVDAIQNHGFVSTYLYDGLSRYPLRTLLRNVLLQWVMGYGSTAAASLEFAIDVRSNKGNRAPNDSTSISPGTPLGSFHAAIPFPTLIWGLGAPKGLSTITGLLQSTSCNLNTSHDLRPDSPKNEALLDPIGADLVVGWSAAPSEPAEIVGARYRTVDVSRRPISDWITVNASRFTNTATGSTVSLFDYDMRLRPGSVHLSTR